MPLIKFTDDPVVKQLRWVAIGTMLFSVANTLAGQPDSFWHQAATAIRGDGLSIDNRTNHTFEFFLGSGWLPYLLASFGYCSIVFLLVSVLPKRVALTVALFVILSNYFIGCNWLAVRWHLGLPELTLYGIALALAIAFSAFPKPGKEMDRLIKWLFWVMVYAVAMDMTNTLLGQPASYWQHPETVYEGNPVSRFFLAHGWYAYLFMDLVYCSAIYWLLSILPRKWSLVLIFYFILVHYIGASNWFYYVWRMGMQTPVIYSIILGGLIAWVGFPKEAKPER